MKYLKRKTQLVVSSRIVQLTSHINVANINVYFMVRMPTAGLSTFMNAEYWPTGVEQQPSFIVDCLGVIESIIYTESIIKI